MRTFTDRMPLGIRKQFLSQGRPSSARPQRSSTGKRRLFLECLENRWLLASDLSITKVDSIDPITPGEFATYTVVATNNGPDAATAIIADTLPLSLTAVTFTSTATGGATGNTALGVGNISDPVIMPSGSTITYTVVGLVSATATGSISNTADINATGATVDNNLTNNSATATTTVGGAEADLQVTKTSGTSSVAAGGNVTYTIVVTNAGPSAVTGATVTDNFSASLTGLTFTAVGDGGASGFAGGVGNINQTVDLPVGATITYTVNATVSGSASGSISNTANVVAPAGVTELIAGNNTAIDTDTVLAATSTADLQITKTDSSVSVAAGGQVTYTIVVTNAGAGTVTGANVRDTFSASLSNVSFTAASTGGATGFANGTGNLNQTVTLPAGATITYTVTGTVNPLATGVLSNTATVNTPAGVAEANASNNIATDIDAITAAQADLQVTKISGGSSVAAGGNVSYVIVVSNAGPSAITGATVTDTFGASLSGVTFTASGTGGASGFANGSGNLNQTVNLPVGATITYVVNATVSGSASGTITNSAAVALPAGAVELDAANNLATDVDTVTAAIATADLQIVKTDAVSTASAGGTVTYTIVVTNSGPNDVIGATVTDDFGASLSGVTFTAVGADGASGFADGSGDLNQVVNLPVGSSITYTVTGTLDAAASGALTNSATVTTPAGVLDVNALNNISVDVDTIAATPEFTDLQITKISGGASVGAGGTVTYAIVVTNAGPTAVTGATVTDTFSSSLSGVTFTASGTGGASGFANGTTNLNQTVNLPVGATITYLVTGTLSGTATGSLVNTATVTAPAGIGELDAANNIAVDIDTISAATATADLAIVKTDAVTTAAPGGTVTYAIIVTNTGPSDVIGATVTDDFAASLSGVSFTAVGTGSASGFAAGSGDLNQVVNLPVGSSITYTVTGTLDAAASGALTNSATVTTPVGIADLNVANNISVDVDVIAPAQASTDLQITKTSGGVSVAPGGTVTYAIVVSNAGPTAVTGATVTDDFAASLSGVTFTASGTGGASGFAAGSGDLNQTVNLPVGATITYTVSGTLSGSATGSLSNTATVTTPAGIGEVDATNNIAVDIDTVAAASAAADLQIVKTDAVSSVSLGGTVIYTIVVTNSGPSDVFGATVTDDFAASLSGVTFTAVGTGSASGFADGSGDLSQVVNLPVGASITYTVTGTLSGSASGTLSNTATVTAPAGTTEIDAGNNVSVDVDTIAEANATTDLQITKTDGVTSVEAGSLVTYTIVVTNAGATTANDVVVTDTFASLLSGVSFTASGTGGASGFASGTGDLNQTVDLPAGATVTYTVTGVLDASATGALANTATVTAPAGFVDVNVTNNIATDIDVIVPPEEPPGGGLVCEVFTDNVPGEPGTAELFDDADNPGSLVLIVTGTPGKDVIIIEPRNHGEQIRVRRNGRTIGTFDADDVQRVVVFADAGNDTVIVNGSLHISATLFGEAGNDVLIAARGDDELEGGPGNDRLIGGAGDDTLCGAEGNDTISGGSGNDLIGGDAGNDKVIGDSGNDIVLGGEGNDFLAGGSGNDQLFGQEGNDRAFGDAGNDVVVGGAGNDRLHGGPGRDILIGGEGRDELRSEGSEDILIGGSTVHDEDSEALAAIMAEWSSSASLSTRRDNLQLGGGLNDFFTLDEGSLIDDGVVDQLWGSSSADWFLLGAGDRARDRTRIDIVN